MKWILITLFCLLCFIGCFIYTHEHGCIGDNNGFGFWWMSNDVYHCKNINYTFYQVWINLKPFKINIINITPDEQDE